MNVKMTNFSKVDQGEKANRKLSMKGSVSQEIVCGPSQQSCHTHRVHTDSP